MMAQRISTTRGVRRRIMPTFKDKELENLSQRILGRAVQQQQPLDTRPSLLGRIRQVTLKRKPQLPRLLRKRF